MNYQDILQLLFNEEMQDIDLDPITQSIETMASKDYWESKNKRLEHLLISEEVARILVQSTLGFTYQIQELIGRIAPMISKGLPYKDMVRNASDVIEACENHVYEVQIGNVIMVKSFYKLNQNTYDYIAQAKYNPPMLDKPKDWDSNDNGGYYDNDTHSMLGSVHCKHNENQALDVLNKLQNIKWELNPLIIEMEEIPNKEFKSPDSHKQFLNMAKASKETYAKYKDKEFYFIWKFDMRGRQYSSGYHINLQSSGYKKASLNFVNKQLITGDL